MSTENCLEYFRFGNGAVSKNSQSIHAPVVIAGHAQMLVIHLVEEHSLGLLLGRNWFEQTGALIDIANRMLIFPDRQEPIVPNPGGRFSVALHPEAFTVG